MPTFYMPDVKWTEIPEATAILVEGRREELEALGRALFAPDRIPKHMQAALAALLPFAARSEVLEGVHFDSPAEAIATDVLDWVAEFGEQEDIFFLQAYAEVVDGLEHDAARFRAKVCEYVLGVAAFYLTCESEGAE